jgi:hypothetical protein
MHLSAAIVLCTSAHFTLVQEVEAQVRDLDSSRPQYAINPPGVWHSLM